MNRLKFLSGILIIILVSSCARYKDIEIGEVQDFKIQGFDNDALVLAVKLPITNPSSFTIHMQQMDARVFMNDTYIGRVNSVDTIILKKKSEEVYDLKLHVRLANLLGSAMKVMNLKHGSKIRLRVEGTAVGKVMGIRKKVSFNETRDVTL